MAQSRIPLGDRPDDDADDPRDLPAARSLAETELRVCPECGTDLAAVHLERHADLHYPDVVHLHDPVYRHEHRVGKERREQLLAGGVTRAEFEAAHTPSEED